ncbi:MAG: LpxI family protein [Candidatus Omnitrophica bacterium]|nr:LpxI family protein [Candidatus Omnitrophota bacterium]
MAKILGLITGSGKLPELILHEAKESGCRVVVCAIQGETDPATLTAADRVEWIKLGQLGHMVKFFKSEQVNQAVMAGKITKTNLFRGEVRPDFEMVKVLTKVRNYSDDSLLGSIADDLNSKGIQILDSTSFLTEEALPGKGILTTRRPSKKELNDVEFGWKLAKEMGKLDVGQTVVVKNKAILAVEAIEGTDEAILRGGVLGNGEVVVVKVAKPKQDMRFDVPTVGLGTLEAMVKARARVLVFEGRKTIVVERKRFIECANSQKISVMAKE